MKTPFIDNTGTFQERLVCACMPPTGIMRCGHAGNPTNFRIDRWPMDSTWEDMQKFYRSQNYVIQHLQPPIGEQEQH